MGHPCTLSYMQDLWAGRYIVIIFGRPIMHSLGSIIFICGVQIQLVQIQEHWGCSCYSHTHQPRHCCAAIGTYVRNRWTKAGKSRLSTHGPPWFPIYYVSGLEKTIHFVVKINFMIMVLVQSTVHALSVALCCASIAPSVLEIRLLKLIRSVRSWDNAEGLLCNHPYMDSSTVLSDTSVASAYIVSHAPCNPILRASLLNPLIQNNYFLSDSIC